VPLIALGSITRESIVVPVIAAGVLAVRRLPNARVLFATGIVAVAPAMLLIHLSYWHELAVITANELGDPVDTTTWGILAHWGSALVHMPLWDLRAEPVWTLCLVVALAVFLLARDRSVAGRAMQGVLIGGIVYLGSMPTQTQLRLESVLFPVAAYGGSLLVENVLGRGRARVKLAASSG
jgi:hypothetical protein